MCLSRLEWFVPEAIDILYTYRQNPHKTMSNSNYQHLYTLIAASLLHDGYVHDGLVQRLLLRSISHVLSLQEHVNLSERRPFRRLPIPTLPHEVVNLSGAVARLRQAAFATVVPVVMAAVVDDLFVGEALERLLPSDGQDLPERDAKRPDVALGREFALQHRNEKF